jgi:RNA polymerase sigma factor (sigma-70 family)
MSPFKSTRWIEYTKYYINLQKYKYCNSKKLKSQDWEDITQDILLHIWKHHKTYKVTKHLKPWLKTIVSRLISNYMRDRCIVIRHSNYLKKSLVLYPDPIISIEKEEDFFGETQTNFIYDTVDQSEPYYARDINEISSILEYKEFSRLKNFLIDLDYKKTAKRLKIQPATLYCTLRKVKKIVKNAKSNPVAF